MKVRAIIFTLIFIGVLQMYKRTECLNFEARAIATLYEKSLYVFAMTEGSKAGRDHITAFIKEQLTALDADLSELGCK